MALVTKPVNIKRFVVVIVMRMNPVRLATNFARLAMKLAGGDCV